MTKRKPEPKHYSVTINYRSAGYEGVSFTNVKATSEAEALEIAERNLRAKYINVVTQEKWAKLSGWNRRG